MSGPFPAYPRCFVGVAPAEPLSPASHCRLSGRVAVGLDWVQPAVLHVTLAFLGWLSADQRAVVREIIGDCAARPPARLALTGGARVVGAEETRSLVAELVPDAALTGYRSALVEALRPRFPSVDPADRFRPHLTMAKVWPGPLPADSAWSVDRLSIAVSPPQLCAGRTIWFDPPESASR
jgi:2'-5' RNA ligase